MLANPAIALLTKTLALHLYKNQVANPTQRFWSGGHQVVLMMHVFSSVQLHAL
jgi:hypothetical protein